MERTLAVGLALKDQIVKELPIEKHDYPVDILLYANHIHL
jgi:5-formyltetrahydrofolate cyclo-ligase